MSNYALTVGGRPYPQRQNWTEAGWLDRQFEKLRTFMLSKWWSREAHMARFVRKVHASYDELERLSQDELAQRLQAVKRDLRRFGPVDDVAARAFALIRWHSKQNLGLAHFDSQICGAYALIRGTIAEMDTGEGKTLTATLGVSTLAMAGNSVHVITVNDYLATRDLEKMKPLYHSLGLSTGLIVEKQSPDEKRVQYRADIVYCTSKILTFDYLRDRIDLGPRMKPMGMSLRAFLGTSEPTMLPGLQYAIIDEVDSVLIDEARTPLIISRETRNNVLEQYYRQAMQLARSLKAGEDYELIELGKAARLNDTGKGRIEAFAEEHGGLWRGKLRREEIITRALNAIHGFQRDIDYLVRDDKIMIIDENTGRVMPDRSWELGLQQLMEIKEGVPISPEKETMGKISFQLFFRRYLNFSGMTGTCKEVALEMGEVYGLPVVRIQPRLKNKRVYLPSRMFVTAEDRWLAVVASVKSRLAADQAVLVGTRSVKASETLSEHFDRAGVDHQVLNAKNDQEEAELVSRAGFPGKVTIATNMAGRGTDIHLDDAVRKAGGLHVILTERHDNRRVDRQLIGRCARQGDPGTCEEMLSLDDELFQGRAPWVVNTLKRMLTSNSQSRLYNNIALRVCRFYQWSVERQHRRIRGGMLSSDFQARRSLSFSGQLE
ncbi:MAG: preprotein translocase subunit SecA [Limnobacter sp.]|uniref:preprotein translocase subunit SecA n=1 Tax=Limnobacter sp. TaxID=2003368 RepID=UPI0039196692